jgi:hypothetical protein
MKIRIKQLCLLGAFFISGISLASELTPPLTPWDEGYLADGLMELSEVIEGIDELLNQHTFKISDVKNLLAKDPFLKTNPIRSGQTQYVLEQPSYFVNGASLTIKLALRSSDTVSGPMRNEMANALKSYRSILEESRKYYDDQRRKIECNQKIHDPYYSYLLVKSRPSSLNENLQNVYNELWRDLDSIPGGTAGILLHEFRNDLELTHLQKARERIANLNKCLNEDTKKKLTLTDRSTAFKVRTDLINALAEVEGYEFTNNKAGPENN